MYEKVRELVWIKLNESKCTVKQWKMENSLFQSLCQIHVYFVYISYYTVLSALSFQYIMSLWSEIYFLHYSQRCHDFPLVKNNQAFCKPHWAAYNKPDVQWRHSLQIILCIMKIIRFLTLYSGCIRKNNLVEMYIFCEVWNTLLRVCDICTGVLISP